MRKSIVYAVAFLFFAQSLMGCQKKWVNTNAWGMSVWGDDDQSVAAAWLSYQSQNTFMTSMTRNFSFQVNTASVDDLNNPVPRGSVITGAPETMYYMANGDYVLVTSRITGDAGTSFETYQVFSGQTRLVQEVGTNQARRSCSGFNVNNNSFPPMAAVPSPDGSVIGSAYLNLLCDGLSVVVELKDAASGESLGETVEYALTPEIMSAWESGTEKTFIAHMKMGWSEDDGLMVGFSELLDNSPTDTIQGWYFEPDEEPVVFETMAPDCFTPPTTSSRLNSVGDQVRADTETGLSINSTSNSSDGFGCDP
jgi:hypothetical protein